MSDEQAATTPAATAVSTTTESGFTPDPTVSEDENIINEIRHEAIKAKTDKSVKELEDSEQESAAAEPAKKEEKDKEKTAPAKKHQYKDADEAVTAIVKAFESGDLDAVAKATGKPKSFFQLNDAKWAHFRGQQDQLRSERKAFEQDKSDFSQAEKLAQQKFGTAIQAAKAYRDGELDKFTVLVKELTGEDYAVAQRKVIQGVLGMDPKLKEAMKKNKELEEKLKQQEQPAKAKEPTQEDRAQAYQQAVTAVKAELAGHVVSKVRGFEDMVLNKIRDSYDADQNAYTLSFQEAADEVVEERRKESEALGFVKGSKAPTPAKPGVKLPPRSRSADARVPDGEPWLTEDLDDEQIIASIHRDMRNGRIK